MEKLVFGLTDYLLLGGLLGLSLLIGIYFGFFSKQNSTDEYLFGGKHMGYLPVGTSIIASLLSGITYLGVPTEVYLYGAFYAFTLINTCITGYLTAFVFMPLFYRLQIKSTYEYLELRFSRRIRRFASFLYILSLMVYVPIIIYVPSLAFAQVTDLKLSVVAPILCAICIVYTALGGVKAVVWTDFVQFFFAVGGLVAVLVLGVISAGGLSAVWQVSRDGQRLDIFNMDASPFVRNTFWAMSFGTVFSSLSHSAVGQKFIQRYLTIDNLTDIKKAVLIKTIGTLVLDAGCVYCGLVIYARYFNCDPIESKIVERGDQIVPYYVMDITRNFPGLSGMFLAGIAGSALSTMSASINTLSGIIYEDFIDQWIPESPTKDSKAANIMKLSSVIIGVVSIGLIFVIEHLGTVLELSYSVRGAADGPLLGFFFLAMFCPWAGERGTLTGGCVGLLFMLWVSAGSKWHIMNNRMRTPHLPTSVENCSSELMMNRSLELQTTTLAPFSPDEEPMLLFKMTFLYFAFFGSIITVVAGLITSFAIGEVDLTKVNPEHISPFFRRFLPKKEYQEVSTREENAMEKNHRESRL
ncbi:hypothetical protein TKK_0017749 [Trichogramma kaykai]|uniref:Sodium-coupled monocarboxylate transporter 1 n=1 Tax=Trichogramma kaykai TaxID=54128 RepID=A0ABD2W279_9HYME